MIRYARLQHHVTYPTSVSFIRLTTSSYLFIFSKAWWRLFYLVRRAKSEFAVCLFHGVRHGHISTRARSLWLVFSSSNVLQKKDPESYTTLAHTVSQLGYLGIQKLFLLQFKACEYETPRETTFCTFLPPDISVNNCILP